MLSLEFRKNLPLLKPYLLLPMLALFTLSKTGLRKVILNLICSLPTFMIILKSSLLATSL